jgi:Solitary outer membrane autotransporter beta-barrel domain
MEQLEDVVGDRVEAVTILGGDYGAAGGLYAFRGGKVANVSVSKFGGNGDVASPRPLGIGTLTWAPVLQGNLGFISADNRFESGFLDGNEMQFDTLAVQGGGGARFYITDHISLAPLVSGIYGHTENEFVAHNAVGQAVKTAATGRLVDWEIDTWSFLPGAEFKYDWAWRRTVFQFGSRYNFIHTESFHSSSPLVEVRGDSHTWENKLDVDVPLGWKVFGRELRTGGFVSRTELSGGIAEGLNANHFYTFNGRLVVDLLGAVWKVRWLGLGSSYFLADHFSGWTAGLDVRFQF